MDTIKTGTYEILIRFNCEKGETFGHIRGCHHVMLTYLVGDDGKIKGRLDTGELPADFSAEQVKDLLGESFTDLVAQIEESRADFARVSADLQAANSEIGSRDRHITGLDASIAELERVLAEANEQIAALTKDTSGK